MPNFRHVILDRDGVLNAEAPGGFVTDPEQFQWLSNVLDGLALLSRAGIRLSVATNQSCVGRGIIDAAALDRVHKKMTVEAALWGVHFDGIYVCPHAPDAGCRCRKPLPGLLESAIHESGIAASETVFIGDAATDLQCARAAGITPWLVRTGKGKNTEATLGRGEIPRVKGPDLRIFDDVLQAGNAIISEEKPKKGETL